MGLGLEGAYGAGAAADALRQIIKDRLEKQRILHGISAEDRRLGQEDIRLRQSDQQRQDILEENKRQHDLINAGRVFNENTALNEAIQPGARFQGSNPLVGRLMPVGGVRSAGIDLAPPESLAATPGQSAEVPGTIANAPSPGMREFQKVETQKQYDTRTDNQRQQDMLARQEARDIALGKQSEASLAATQAERAAADRRAAATLAESTRFHTGMLNKPTGGNTPVVVAGPNGPMLLNRGANRATPVLDEAGNPIGPAPTAQQRNVQSSYSKARPVIQGISELSEKINVNQGLQAKAIGAAERAKAAANLNDDVAEYQSLIEGFTPLIARAMGHTGVLTQQDVDSVKRMFPTPGDSKSLRDRKVARLESLMSQIEGAAPGVETAAPPALGKKSKFEIVGVKD